RASEHKGVNSSGNHWIEIARDGLVGQFVIEHSFFDQRHKQRTGLTGDSHMNIQRAQRILISATANRRARANYSDVSISGRGDRGLRSWFNYTDYRKRDSRTQFRNGD